MVELFNQLLLDVFRLMLISIQLNELSVCVHLQTNSMGLVQWVAFPINFEYRFKSLAIAWIKSNESTNKNTMIIYLLYSFCDNNVSFFYFGFSRSYGKITFLVVSWFSIYIQSMFRLIRTPDFWVVSFSMIIWLASISVAPFLHS